MSEWVEESREKQKRNGAYLDFHEEIGRGFHLDEFAPVVHVEHVLVELLSEQKQERELLVSSLGHIVQAGLEVIASLCLCIGSVGLNLEL
jgi:hypothetical protein